ncbi:sensor histidine kinase [Micromonospora sp. DR5-3]|uniref:sensor histidine kinase n=1 Tax=unclassified Micromonospora TaxID=2617518 RepID=UPI002103E86C|nr:MULTISPECIES: sensor histidine kinase [unclassified Micromonospora]MCW3817568.1 sensor histidine kinase [Micromonospora sp. DR5-3]
MTPDRFAVSTPVIARGSPRRLLDPLAIINAQSWARALRAAAHFTAGFPFAVITAAIVVTLTALGVVLWPVLLWANRLFTWLQRARFRQCLGVTIPPPPRAFQGSNRLSRMFAEMRAAATLRQLGYHLIASLTSTIGFAVVLVGWSLGVPLALVVAYAWTLPEVNALGWSMHSPLILLGLTAAGLILCLGARSLLGAIAAADAAAAAALLGPSRTERLRHRVAELTETRAGLVDAADAERRRIERDLHDGAQQRLISLAMNLGLLRKSAADLPPPLHEAIVQAHGDAKLALAELRRLVRGLHPAVLDARGLDAALSGIAASSPIPVNLRVDVPRRPAPAIEAVAYFVVSEALTNVARHAEARSADVRVWTEGDRLHVVASDDGRGGASVDGGSGLRGLGQRVSTVDGKLWIESPPGKGTTITVELPCAS